jgi:hypothetical protein
MQKLTKQISTSIDKTTNPVLSAPIDISYYIVAYFDLYLLRRLEVYI